MKKVATSLLTIAALGVVSGAIANATFQTLPFSQNWSNAALITANDDWSGVPGIVGFLGDHDAGSPTGVDPQTVVADVAVAVDVIANQVSTAITNGGVAEFDLADDVVGLQGSGTADAPYLLLHINTSGFQSILLSYNVRDIDGTADNAVQQVAAQYRIGTTGPWTNIAGTYIADATTGPSLATLVTPIAVALPGAADNQPQVQIRILTTNAVGNDEWVGIDDITVEGTPIATDANTPSWGQVKVLYR